MNLIDHLIHQLTPKQRSRDHRRWVDILIVGLKLEDIVVVAVVANHTRSCPWAQVQNRRICVNLQRARRNFTALSHIAKRQIEVDGRVGQQTF